MTLVIISNGRRADNNELIVKINPNADEANFAHELGHLVSRQTDVGNIVRELRDNPKLKTALLGAMVTVPGFAAALEVGVGYGYIHGNSPVGCFTAIIDETVANINAYGIMNNAGGGMTDVRLVWQVVISLTLLHLCLLVLPET